MRIYWKGAWLGYAVLVCLAIAEGWTLKAGFGNALPAWLLFDMFFFTWAFRGFIRFIGRALGTRQ